MNNNNNRRFKQQTARIGPPFTIRSRHRHNAWENLTKQAVLESIQAGCLMQGTIAGYSGGLPMRAPKAPHDSG
jgi:hypothetical protein